jgi:hypothetical protein
MSWSDGTRTSGTRKTDSAAPVLIDFFDQFTRDWGLAKYIGSVYSVYYGLMGIRDLASRLMTYIELSRKTEEQEEEVQHHIDKLEPLIKWFDQWMYGCMEVPEEVNGKMIIRSIGFYHLRRQSVMPVRFEMRVILEGFTEPIANADYSEMRKYALYGEEDEKGIRRGGVKNIANQMESHFHHIINVVKKSPVFFEEETMSIGDEREFDSLEEIAEQTHEQAIQQEIERIRNFDLEEAD